MDGKGEASSLSSAESFCNIKIHSTHFHETGRSYTYS